MAPHLVMAPHLSRSAYKVKGQQSAHLSLSLSLLKATLLNAFGLKWNQVRTFLVFLYIYFIYFQTESLLFFKNELIALYKW